MFFFIFVLVCNHCCDPVRLLVVILNQNLTSLWNDLDFVRSRIYRLIFLSSCLLLFTFASCSVWTRPFILTFYSNSLAFWVEAVEYWSWIRAMWTKRRRRKLADYFRDYFNLGSWIGCRSWTDGQILTIFGSRSDLGSIYNLCLYKFLIRESFLPIDGPPPDLLGATVLPWINRFGGKLQSFLLFLLFLLTSLSF